MAACNKSKNASERDDSGVAFDAVFKVSWRVHRASTSCPRSASAAISKHARRSVGNVLASYRSSRGFPRSGHGHRILLAESRNPSERLCSKPGVFYLACRSKSPHGIGLRQLSHFIPPRRG
jgi:hypothetical protein